ncbi:SH3 domain-containing protein [bacterium]|nr:SH3 domain-containing protein [bacterium]
MRRTASFLLFLVLLCIPMASFAAKELTKKEKERIKNSVVVKIKQAAIREKADTASKTVETITQFTPVEVISRDEKWVKVKTYAGRTGFMQTNSLSPNPFISLDAAYANMRSGPGGSDPVLWRIEKRHWPFLVLDKKSSRVKVRDYEGDEGWIHENLLSPKNYVIVKLKYINLREGPGLDDKQNPLFPKRFTAERGVVFEVLEEKDGWVLVRHADGDKGWCSGKIVWGSFPEFL